MDNTLIDNSNNLKMVDTLKQCMSDPTCQIIKIATGYWDIPGLSLVRNELNSFLSRENTEFQLLIGTDPIVRASQVNSPKYKGQKFPEDYIKVDINELDLKQEYCDAVKILLDYCKTNEDKSKIKIRIFRTNDEGDAQFLHAKCYIFLGQNTCGIVGSSNFTQKGLEGNAELNHLESNSSVVMSKPEKFNKQKGHNLWFDEKWQLAKPWNKSFLEEILNRAPITIKAKELKKNISITPYELYIKYLQQQFGDIVDTSLDNVIKSYLPTEYTALKYQIDAVKECFSIMKRYGGFILGDVVGLGKTIVGLLIIKQFISTSSSFGRSANILIIAPPSILPAWKKTINDFDKNQSNKVLPYIDFITTGSIDKISDEEEFRINELLAEEFDTELLKKRYGLILIDESHNFRNSNTNKYQELNDLIGRTNPTPYIGLLSATPQNNSPRDLKNQIYLFQREPNNSNLPGIEGGKLDSFFSHMENEFYKARNNPDEKESKYLIANLSKAIRDKVLNELVVRRTRSDIKHLYEDDSKQLKFPSIKGPHKLEYLMDEELSKLFFETMIAITPLKKDEKFDSKIHIGFYRYAAINFFKDDKNKRMYEKRNLTVASISRRLQNIMRILLVKRLESSFTAFKTSLHNLLNYTNNMIEMLENNQVFICPDLDVNKEFKDAKYDFEEAAEALRLKINKKKGNNREYKKDDFEDNYIDLLKNDRKLIAYLCEKWDKNDYDPKFDKFKKSLNSILFNKEINNPSGYDKPRLVIFTEAIDTLKALSRAINNNGHKALMISATNRNKLQKVITENFDANSSIKKDDFDVIVTTEVLSEGVNLHRANIILNYDAPWNSTKLMQRIGRINRIGSKEEYVHVFNFFPTTQSNEQIRLIEKAYAKLQAFHSMFGEDNKVFSEREELSEVDLTHMEEDDESPFCQYIKELKDYYEQQPMRYNQLKELPFEELGGELKVAKIDKSLVGITDSTNGLVCFTIDSLQRANIFVPLETMSYLKNNTNNSFISISDENKSNLFKVARRAFDSHAVHYLTAKDINKNITRALAVLRNIRQAPGITKESLRLVSTIDNAVRHGNTFIIKTLLRYKQQQDSGDQSLFDINFDLNQWLETTFHKTAEKAAQKRNEIRTAFFEYTNNKSEK